MGILEWSPLFQQILPTKKLFHKPTTEARIHYTAKRLIAPRLFLGHFFTLIQV